MAHYNTIMNELLRLIPRHRFETLVRNYGTDRYVKKFDCWNQLTVLLYAQAGSKNSLRDIEQSLLANSRRLYHWGSSLVKRSTLSDANQNRDYRIYESLFYKFLERCKDITPKHKFKFNNPLYSLDATVIDLALDVFPWARFQKIKGALRLHYQYDYSGNIPSFLIITDAKKHEITVTKQFFSILPDSIYCFDKGYTDYGFFKSIERKKAYFVTRAKENMDYQVLGQHNPKPAGGVLSDEVIELTGHYRRTKPRKAYRGKLRLIRFIDKQTGKVYKFLTNNFKLASLTIAQVYKSRWMIEAFFKWIKQNLKIKTFLGTSKNAVLTQIWVAMIYYLLLAYIKYQSRYKHSLFYLHRVIQATLTANLSIIDLLRAPERAVSKLGREEYQYAFL